MILGSALDQLTDKCIPRAGGDDPNLLRFVVILLVYSPRRWG